MYAYNPLSLRALGYILEHESLGQTARFERFAAGLLHLIAAGQKIDPDKTPKFSAQVDEVYRNPFIQEEKPMTADEIKQHIVDVIHELKNGG